MSILEHNQILVESNFQSQAYLDKISDWTNTHLMKLNSEKSKYMVVNYTNNYQFNARLSIDNNSLNQVRQTRLLGVLVNDQLSWHANTDFIVKKAYKRMMILHNLFEFSLPVQELVNIYILYIRSVLESSAVVWHSSITKLEESQIERVQKTALKVILADNYEDYTSALIVTGLDTLSERRKLLCKKFAKIVLKVKE